MSDNRLTFPRFIYTTSLLAALIVTFISVFNVFRVFNLLTVKTHEIFEIKERNTWRLTVDKGYTHAMNYGLCVKKCWSELSSAVAAHFTVRRVTTVCVVISYTLALLLQLVGSEELRRSSEMLLLTSLVFGLFYIAWVIFVADRRKRVAWNKDPIPGVIVLTLIIAALTRTIALLGWVISIIMSPVEMSLAMMIFVAVALITTGATAVVPGLQWVDEYEKASRRPWM